MPKNKKKWVDKKNSETFRVVHRSQKDPLVASESAGQHVLQPLHKKDMEEQIKYGVYYDDDYNYLQHLRDLNEVTEYEEVERIVAQAPAKGNSLPSTLFETKGMELNVGLLNQAASQGCAEEMDPDIAAALEGDFDFDDPNNVLEDSFVALANGGEPSDVASLRPTNAAIHSDAESDDEDASETSDSEYSGHGHQEEDDEEEYKQSISCVDANKSGESRLIDEQFDRFCDDYGDDEIGDAQLEEEGGYPFEGDLLEPDSHRMLELVEDHKKNNTELVLVNDEIARKFAEEENSDEDCERLERISIECTGPKKAKWDCESVLTTYSNVFNRPALIKDANNRPRKKRLAPALAQLEPQDTEMSVMSGRSVSTVRPRGETLEEKKARKAAVKELRAERRVEKKCNKLAFKEERVKLAATRRTPAIKTTPIA